MRYVHWGATSQDAIDTGLVLQLRGALDAAETLLEQLLAALALRADRYRDTVMPGRTWMQHALPVTLARKLAGTLDALLRWQQRLREMRPRLLVLQFGGAASWTRCCWRKGRGRPGAGADPRSVAAGYPVAQPARSLEAQLKDFSILKLLI